MNIHDTAMATNVSLASNDSEAEGTSKSIMIGGTAPQTPANGSGNLKPVNIAEQVRTTGANGDKVQKEGRRGDI